MKKQLIIALAFMLATKLATAQTEKGTQNLGLDLSVAGQNQSGIAQNYVDNGALEPTTNKTNQFNIGPTYSYFIANRLDIGADFSYSHFQTRETPEYEPEKQVQNNYSGEIFVRKYFMCSDKFGFRAGPYAGYGKLKESYVYTNNYPGDLTISSTQEIYAGLALDLVYYPAKHLGISATLANAQYAHEKQNNGDLGSNTSNNYSLALITDGVGLSVFYTFGGK